MSRAVHHTVRAAQHTAVTCCCSEAEARQRKQEQARLDMLAANERQMQLKAGTCDPCLHDMSSLPNV